MSALTDNSLEGKVAIITGSARQEGLGFAIASRLAAAGARVVVSDLPGSQDVHTPAAMVGDTTDMAAAVKKIEANGGTAVAHPCDVRDPEAVEALADAGLAAFGRLDIWVNNAGIGYIMKPILEVSPQEWTSVIDVNLSGAFYGMQAAARKMIEQGMGGSIVNIASQAAKSGFPFAQAYCSSKHGLVGLVRSAAQELGEHQIRVNNVCPNHVTTGLGAWQNDYFSKKQGKTLDQYLADMTSRIPMGRAGLPEDTANAVAFLCSDAARYITAESLNVSGGEEPH